MWKKIKNVKIVAANCLDYQLRAWAYQKQGIRLPFSSSSFWKGMCTIFLPYKYFHLKHDIVVPLLPPPLPSFLLSLAGSVWPVFLE